MKIVTPCFNRPSLLHRSLVGWCSNHLTIQWKHEQYKGILTPAQRFTIGKEAAEYGTMATMKYFAKKYPGKFGFLKETTVRQFKNLYEAELQFSGSKTEDPTELPLKKTGRPLMLGNEHDKQVREYVYDLQAMEVTIYI